MKSILSFLCLVLPIALFADPVMLVAGPSTANINVVRSMGEARVVKVELVKIARGKELPKFARTGSAVHLEIELGHYCNNLLLLDHNQTESRLRYFDLAPNGLPSTGCNDTLDYFWSPDEYDISTDSSKDVLLHIGAYTAAVTVTKRMGVDPDSGSRGFYMEYSNPKLTK